MSDLVKRLRESHLQWLPTSPHTSEAHKLLRHSADRLEALEAALRQARAALVYHTEQTRPIGVTGVALAAINDLLKD